MRGRKRKPAEREGSTGSMTTIRTTRAAYHAAGALVQHGEGSALAALVALQAPGAVLEALRQSGAEAGHFAERRHRILFQRMQSMAEDGKPLELELLAAELEAADELGAVGGVAAIGELADLEASGAYARHYLEAVRRTTEARSACGPGARLGELVAMPAAAVEPQEVRWLWCGRIPCATTTVLDGDPGLGKSTLSCDLAARVSRGRPMPDGSGGGEAAAVLLLSAEDDPAMTIRPRLERAGADLERCLLVDCMRTPDGDRATELPTDVVALERKIREAGVRLVVVDPLMAFLPATVNTHRDQDIRLALRPLAQVAARTGAAFLIVRHLNKSAGASPLYRGGGSIGIIGAARAGLLFARDPEHDDRRVLAVTKSNLGPPAPALGCRLVSSGEVARIEWLGEAGYSAEDLLAVPTDRDERSAIEEATAFLRDALAEGPVPARDVKRAAREQGISDRTLARARRTLGGTARKAGFGRGAPWVWSLPDSILAIKDAYVPSLRDGNNASYLASMASAEEPDGRLEGGRTCPRCGTWSAAGHSHDCSPELVP